MATNNRPKMVEIIAPKDVWQGKADAPVALIGYGDYESEACAKAHEVVKKLLQTFDNKLKFSYRHFPLTQIHQRSHKAAEAAVAAAQEGKFWDMHELLFRNRKHLGSVSLKEYAREAGVVDKNFLPKLVDSLYGWTVRNDLLEGLNKGVRDVPAFFINNEPFIGKPTFENLRKAIEEALRAGKRKTPVKQRA